MRTVRNSEFTIEDAIGMYRRLRERGQNSTLARLSVEARCSDLTPQERKSVRQILREYEANAA